MKGIFGIQAFFLELCVSIGVGLLSFVKWGYTELVYLPGIVFLVGGFVCPRPLPCIYIPLPVSGMIPLLFRRFKFPTHDIADSAFWRRSPLGRPNAFPFLSLLLTSRIAPTCFVFAFFLRAT